MKLLLFLTFGNSIEDWKKNRILDRELEIYLKLISKGWEIKIIY